MTKKKKIGLWIGIIILVIILFGVLTATGVFDLLSDVEFLQNWLASFGTLCYLVYIGIFVLGTVFLLPASVFTIVGGLLFGPIKGTLLALTGATVSTAISFLITPLLGMEFYCKKISK